MIVTVTPNPGLDLTYRLPAGQDLCRSGVEVHRAVSVTLEASGKGVNVSRGLARAGRATTAVLPVGGATGHHLIELLTAEHIAHRVVRQAGTTRVNTTVLTDGGATTKVNAPGPEVTPDEVDNLVVAVDDEIGTQSSVHRDFPEASDHWLAICGSMPPGVEAADLIGRLVRGAHRRGWQVAVDSSGDGLQAALAAGADLLAPNVAELETLRPPDGSRPSPVAALAAGLARERGCRLIVSLGPDGGLWTDGRQTLHARGPVVTPVNTAGAGDALLAGWFSAAPGSGPQQRLAAAVRWGTAACLVPTTVGGDPLAVGPVRVDLLERVG